MIRVRQVSTKKYEVSFDTGAEYKFMKLAFEMFDERNKLKEELDEHSNRQICCEKH